MNAVEYIHSLRPFGKKAGLENIRALLSLLGNPHEDLRFVHVAGTNGKGSVSVMISSILIAQNKKVGLFTSPFIECFNERICINNIPIPDTDLARLTLRVNAAVDALAEEGVFCTVFDVICAVGFMYFAEQHCHVVVLEVGLGGRFDSTNVISAPLCSVICAIGYDHMQYLGDSLDKIAFEKCGIIKPACPVVVYPLQAPEAEAVIRSACKDKSSDCIMPCVEELEIIQCNAQGSRFMYRGREYCISLAGEYQIYNALCAIEAAYACGAEYEDVKNGIKDALWKCRFEIFERRGKTVVLDGAHNSHGISAFLSSAEKFFAGKKVHYVFGILNEKDVETSCSLLAGADGGITVTSVPSERCTDPMAVFRLMKSYRDDADYIDDNIRAVDAAMASDAEIICVLGSLYMVGAVRKYVENLS